MRIDDFLAEQSYSEKTRKSYRWFLSKLDGWSENGRVESGEFRAVDFERWVSDRGWGPSTERIAQSAVRAYLNWAHAAGHAFVRKMRGHEPKPGRSLSESEIRKLLAACWSGGRTRERDLAIVRILLDCGARASEICTLQLADTDLKARRLTFRQKGGRIHQPVISRATGAAIRKFTKLRRRMHPDHDALFCAVGGRKPGCQLTVSGLRSIMQRLGRRARIGALTTHDMRRTFAVQAARHNTPAPLIKVQGGWRTDDMVMRYTRGLTTEDFRPQLPSYRNPK